ncbi:MAG TPA: histidinol-phosphate transaminase [Nitrospirae bacterium]|nr:histidinol-phosphate aminotransferase 2 [bacterium BMS3Abin09]HDH34327.1 histidinol-phosphate transaminase [Nitrospirota bacterium]HDZ83594.1 histidinol-phosphate transaminase [Nitrospirota bacterium]
MIQPPEHIKSIKPYVPGKPVEELERELGISDPVKLASNENPAGPSPMAIKALRKGVADLNRYPDGDCYYLRDALAVRLGINGNELIFGNGSNEIIELAVRTFMGPGDEAVMAHPSFVVYSMIVQAVKGKNIIVPLKNAKHDLDAMASAITDRTRIIFIANPNNPTGTINTAAEMDAFMKRVPDDVLVVVDEAYYEYVSSPEYADSMKYFRQERDILILRTFSKIYGLSGLRIGYGISKAGIVSEMNRIRQPFNVNSLAQRAALAALDDRKHIERSRGINERGKKYIYKGLKSLGISFVPTEANFVFMTFENDIAAELYEELLKQGVIIRPMGPRAIRVTIGLARENKRFIEALRGVWEARGRNFLS